VEGIFQGGVEGADEGCEEGGGGYGGSEDEDRGYGGDDGHDETAPSATDCEKAKHQFNEGCDERDDIRNEHKLGDLLVGIQSAIHALGDVGAAGIETPHVQRVEPVLRLSARAECDVEGIVPRLVPRAVVPQTNVVEIGEGDVAVEAGLDEPIVEVRAGDEV